MAGTLSACSKLAATAHILKLSCFTPTRLVMPCCRIGKMKQKINHYMREFFSMQLSRMLLTILLTVSIAGCGSLPRIVPDMDSQSANVIRIKGGRGILSAEQSQAALDKLKNGKQENLILEKHLAVEEAITGSPLVAGNK